MRYIMLGCSIILAGCAPTYESAYQIIPSANPAVHACSTGCHDRFIDCQKISPQPTCMAAYAECHETCGGRVIEDRRCVAGCSDDYVAPVATPSMGGGEEI